MKVQRLASQFESESKDLIKTFVTERVYRKTVADPGGWGNTAMSPPVLVKIGKEKWPPQVATWISCWVVPM